MNIFDILKEFGFPIACAIIVGYAYWKAVSERIKKLEEIINKQGQTIGDLQNDRLKRAETYASTLKDITIKLNGTIREHSIALREHHSVIREQHVVLRDLIDNLRVLPCMTGEEETRQIRKKHPSSAELPAIPESSDPSISDIFPTKKF